MNILVCGSEGYIGAQLCELLTNQGYKLTRYDIKIANTSLPLKTDFVIDLIAYPRILECEKDFQLAINSNVGTLKRIVKYCIKQNVPLLFGSSVEVFGDRYDRISPNDPYNPKNFYACTKIMGEYLTSTVKNSIVVRFSHVFGNNDPYTNRLIPQLLYNPMPLVYNNLDKKLDFTHIDFVCEWVVDIIEPFTSRNGFELYKENIVTGFSFSIQEILNALGKKCIMKHDTFREKIEIQHQIFHQPSRASEHAHILAYIKNKNEENI